jgi:hypothetical protein
MVSTRSTSGQGTFADVNFVLGASDYGNEKEAGEGVARAIKDGLVKREDLCKRLLFAALLLPC